MGGGRSSGLAKQNVARGEREKKKTQTNKLGKRINGNFINIGSVDQNE
jgi:hypothetical protein